MKIAHIADIHIADGRIDEFKEMLDSLRESIEARDVDMVVFAGDMFIHRDRLSQMQVQLTREFFHKLKQTVEDVIIIPGNHDATMTENKVDSLTAVFSNEKELPVWTQISDVIHKGNYKFMVFPYPSRNELTRLELRDVNEIYHHDMLKQMSQYVDDNKNYKHILLYHGTMEGFNISDAYIASENAIGVGKEMMIPKWFWEKFDAVMAGHLHKYQAIGKAVYPSCPFPLTFADSGKHGWVLWDDLDPQFVELQQKYPYTTVDIGDLTPYRTGLTDESLRRIRNDKDWTDARVRVKYLVSQPQAGLVGHAEIAEQFTGAKDIKIVPTYQAPSKTSDKSVGFEDFEAAGIGKIISKYIDDNAFHPDVKEIAELIEKRMGKKYSAEEEQGIHFKLSKLSMSNFKCFPEDTPTVDFTKLESVVGIFGKNKVGKSALIEAIMWGLFGTTPRNKEVTSVIRNGQEATEVTVEFISHNDTYKIERIRTLSGSVTKLWKYNGVKWEDKSGADKRVTQTLIENLVGSYDMFISTVYSPQNGIDLLVKKRPGERKQIILDCLQINVLERRQQEIADIRKTVKEKIQQAKGKVDILATQVSNLEGLRPAEMLGEFRGLLSNERINQARVLGHLEKLNKQIYNYQELRDENDRLTTELGAIRDNIRETENKIKQKVYEKDVFEGVLADKSVIDRGLQRIADAEGQIARYMEEKVRQNERTNKVNQLQQQREALNNGITQTVSALGYSIKALVTQAKGLQSMNCPNGKDCPLEKKIQAQKDSLRIEIDDLNDQITVKKTEQAVQTQALTDQILQLEKEAAATFYDGSKHMGYVQAVKDEKSNKWGDLKSKMASGEEILNSMLELIAAYTRQVTELREKREAVLNRRTEIAEKIVTVDAYKREVDTTRNNLAITNSKITEYEGQMFKCEKNIEDAQTFQKTLSNEKEKLEKMEDYLVNCAKYHDIVSKRGVVFSLVDKAIPVISRFTQDLLSATTNGAISVSVNSFRTLAKGGTTDDVNIQISDAKGTRDVLEGSGAETVLVSLALRAAMSHLLSLRMGSSVELFIVDEGMGALDDENIVVVKDIFKRLGTIFNQVLFITHVGELKDIAQSRIEVTSNSVISKLNITEKKNG